MEDINNTLTSCYRPPVSLKPALQRSSESFPSVPVLRERRRPDGGVNLPPIGALAPFTFDSQQFTVLLSEIDWIHSIPLQLAMLCFHILT